MTEEWRSVKDYEGLYEVSNTGMVRRVHYPTYRHKEKWYKTI